MALKWSLDKIKEFIENEGYEFIEYVSGIGKESRIKVWCKNPNHEPYEVVFNNFKRGTRCKKCYNDDRLVWTEDKIKKVIEDKGYKLLKVKEGKGVKTIVTIQCSNGHIYDSTIFNISQGYQCRSCYMDNHMACTKEDIYDTIEKYDDKLIKMEEFRGLETKLILYCDKCNKNYEKVYEKYLNGGKCPYCSETRGERKIRKFLENNNIKFIAQYRIDDCRYKYPLPFDFCIEINGEKMLLEFDGLEHFQPIDYFGGEEKFNIRKRNDSIKNEYCKNNNIKLIRISYLDYDNIEEILKEKLNLE